MGKLLELTRRGRLRRRMLLFGTVAAVALVAAPLALADATITSPGPLTSIETTSTLNCAVNHAGDSAGEFYGGTACGTLIAVGGTLYGPASIPAGGNASPKTTYTPVSQTGVTGSGTSVDPYKIVTVVTAGSLTLTQTDTYVTGQEAYRTDVAVKNNGTSTANAILYRAGDCYLQNSDQGYGSVDTTSGAVACTTTDGGAGRIEQWYPITSGSSYYESGYASVWAQIGQQLAFPDTCACHSYIDNGAGLSWNLAIPAGGTVTESHYTTFSPLGIQPLATTKTADSATASAGGGDGYTITIHNPNTTAQTVDAVTDTLPAGFSYVSGSTSGATTSNPSVSGQNLTWSGPFSIAGGADLTLHFGVTVSSATGTYYNNAGGTSSSATIVPTGDTAPIAVSTAADITRPTCRLSQVIAGPPKQINVVVQDSGSGLASVVVTTSTNADTPVPPFTVGTNDAVSITATKINQSAGSTVALKVTDVAGNVTVCDPVWPGVRTGVVHGLVGQTFTHVLGSQGKVTIVNRSAGARSFRLVVNGKPFTTTIAAGHKRIVNVAAALKHGAKNTITVRARAAKVVAAVSITS